MAKHKNRPKSIVTTKRGSAKIHADGVEQKAQSLVNRLNKQTKAKTYSRGDSIADRREPRGKLKLSASEAQPAAATAEEFVRRLTRGGKTGQPLTDKFCEALSEQPKERKRKPAKNKEGHRGNTLKDDEVSLRDGETEEGFFGPQEPQV